ncbi:MAG: hypothetical protein U1E65_22900 [Myxococcota bacterium]
MWPNRCPILLTPIAFALGVGCGGTAAPADSKDAGPPDHLTEDRDAGSRADSGATPLDSGIPSRPAGRHLCPISTDGLANGDRYSVFFYGTSAVIRRTLELESCGDTTAHVLSADLSGSGGRGASGKFEVNTPGLPATLAPGQRLSYEVTYHADQTGEVNDVISFSTDSGPEPIAISLLGNTRPSVPRIPCRLNTTAPCDIGLVASGALADGSFQASIFGSASCRVHVILESTPPGALVGTLSQAGTALPLDGAPPTIIDVVRAAGAPADASGLLRVRGIDGTTGPECFLELR